MTQQSNVPSGGFLLILGAAVLWGTTGTSQALAPTGANPLSIGAVRILIGGLALLLLAIVRGGFRRWTHWSIPLTAVAAISTALYQVSFFGGVRLTGVALGTMVGIGSAPIFAGALGTLFAGEKITVRWVIATGLAIFGCVILIGAGDGRMVVNPLGILLSLGAGLSYAVFTLANKGLLRDHASDEVMAVSFCLGAILLLPTLLFVNTGWIASTGGLVVALHLGLIATGLSYALFGRGLRTVAVSTTATLSLAEPLTAALLGIFVVREVVSVTGVVGMLLIFSGLLLLALKTQ